MAWPQFAPASRSKFTFGRCGTAIFLLRSRKAIGRVNCGGESLRAYKVCRMALMIYESRDPHHARAIGRGRIGAELPDQLPNCRLRLFLSEPLHRQETCQWSGDVLTR